MRGRRNKMRRLSPRNRSNRLSLKSNSKLSPPNSNNSRLKANNRINSASSVNSRTTPLNSSNKSIGSKISNDSNSSKLRDNRISNANSVKSRTTPLNSSNKLIGSKISSDSSRPGDSKIINANNDNNRTTGLQNSEALSMYVNNRSLGEVIEHTAGSPSTATGSNAAVTTVIEFPMTASAATMAGITVSASTLSP